MVTPNPNFVPMVVDLARLDKPLIHNALPNVYLVGKEVDILESIRRTDNIHEMDIKLINWHGMALNINLSLMRFIIQAFQTYGMIEIENDERVTLCFTNTEEVYKYGLNRMKELLTEKEIALIDYLIGTWKKPLPADELYKIINLFDKPFRELLESFFIENNILKPFYYKNESNFVSPRIYKNENNFRTAYEILEDNKLSNITDFLIDNPGNPFNVVQRHTKTSANVLDILNQSGIIDPLKLNVKGDEKAYLFSTDLLSDRKDQDHFDLVKMTLANFRYGQYYSKISTLRRLDDFLSSLLDRGFAGRATAIGTDYKNLEIAGIVKVRDVVGGLCRFWLLKRDVIEDARSVLRGNIPITSNLSVSGIENMESIVRTRSTIQPNLRDVSIKKIAEAIRQIEEELK